MEIGDITDNKFWGSTNKVFFSNETRKRTNNKQIITAKNFNEVFIATNPSLQINNYHDFLLNSEYLCNPTDKLY